MTKFGLEFIFLFDLFFWPSKPNLYRKRNSRSGFVKVSSVFRHFVNIFVEKCGRIPLPFFHHNRNKCACHRIHVASSDNHAASIGNGANYVSGRSLGMAVRAIRRRRDVTSSLQEMKDDLRCET